MSRYDARLVAWLVRNHLLLSLTAQKRDISDPAVIRDFAGLIGDEVHLDYLYLLTVADVRGTNPKLWNSWKAQLFEELYGQAKRALRRGLEKPIDRDELIAERKAAARSLPGAAGVPAPRIDEIWAELGDDYFLRCRPEEIAWHTRLLAAREDEGRRVLVGVQDEASGAGTSVVVYAPQDRSTFATATAVLDELGLNIADARIIRLGNGFSLSTYVVLENGGEQIRDDERRDQILRRLEQAITAGEEKALRVTRRPPRQVRMFSTPTHRQLRRGRDQRPHRDGDRRQRPPGPPVPGRAGAAQSPGRHPGRQDPDRRRARRGRLLRDRRRGRPARRRSSAIA